MFERKVSLYYLNITLFYTVKKYFLFINKHILLYIIPMKSKICKCLLFGKKRYLKVIYQIQIYIIL